MVPRARATNPLVPSSLEELHNAIVQALNLIRSDVSSTRKRDLVHPEPAARLIVDSSQTMAIMGDRGSGKTTLLASVCATIEEIGKDLVLPIMRPELFHEGDTVIGAFLASLWSVVPTTAEEAPLEPADVNATSRGPSPRAELLQMIAETSRQYAMSRTTVHALEYSSDGPFDFAEDSVAVARSGTALFWNLRRLVHHVTAFGGGGAERLIVVPIDDPDLSPTSILAMLRDLRVLGSIPGVVAISCFSSEDLTESWLSALQTERPAMSRTRLAARFAREMEKIFPYRNRFEIEPLTVRQRIDFSPLGESETLATKLGAFGAVAAELTRTSSLVVDSLSRPEPILNLENPLPGNPRTLVQLWESLDSLTARGSASGSDQLVLSLRRIIDIIGEPFNTEVGRNPGGRVVSIGRADATSSTGARHASFRRQGTELFVATGGDFDPVVTDDTTIRLRPLVAVRASKPSEDASGGPRETLSPEATSSLLALQEVVYGSGVLLPDEDPTDLGYSEWRFLQRVRVSGQETDNCFFLLPDAVTLSEVRRAASLWNSLAAFSDRRRSTEQLLAAAVEASCAYVGDNPIPQLPKRVPEYDDCLERAAELFVNCSGSGSHIDRNFCAWYRRYLPLQWHSAFLPSSRIRRYVEQHRELCRTHGEDVVDSGPPLDFFEARMRVITDEIADEDDAQEQAWIAGYFDLAAAWGSEHTSRLGEMHPLWQRRAAAQSAGAAALGRAPQGTTHRRFAPYETPEGQELLDAALTVLRRAKKARSTHHPGGPSR